MSLEGQKKARRARDHMEEAERSAKVAKEIFEGIGDTDGKKRAEEVEENAKQVKKYVEKRLGKNEN